MSGMTPRERAIRQRLKNDFPHYAEKCLKVRTKAGEIEPLILNRSQLYVDGKLNGQIARTGMVRALILKARQWGCSTYVEGRFFHRVTHRRGFKAFILTQSKDATDNLFGMASRFYEKCPALVRPHLDVSNAKEMVFDKLDSGYSVATAGSKSAGRSDTLQLFHGSEVAWWPNAADHMTGALQAVPKLPGTEVILESTANGPMGVFYDECMAALAGESEFELIFVPWFWHEEYETEPPELWVIPPKWQVYQRTHDLTRAQVFWAFSKNRELAKASAGKADEPCWRFRQEYPATPHEAFQIPRTEGVVYKNFGEENVREDIEDLGGTIWVGMDFNVDPMSAVLCSKAGDELHQFDEIVIPNGNTEEMAREIRARYPDRDVVVCPDPSGKARKTSAPVGQTDFTILKERKFRVKAPNAAPPVADRINEVNGLCEDENYRRRYFVHPRCKHTITGLQGLSYKPNTSQPDKSLGLDHITDALGYLVHQEFPITKRTAHTQPIQGLL